MYAVYSRILRFDRILVGTHDKADSINGGQIAGRDDITNFSMTLIVGICWKSPFFENSKTNNGRGKSIIDQRFPVRKLLS